MPGWVRPEGRAWSGLIQAATAIWREGTAEFGAGTRDEGAGTGEKGPATRVEAAKTASSPAPARLLVFPSYLLDALTDCRNKGLRTARTDASATSRSWL